MLKKHKYKLLILKSYVVTPYKSYLQSKCYVPYPDEVKYDIPTKMATVCIKIVFLFRHTFCFKKI